MLPPRRTILAASTVGAAGAALPPVPAAAQPVRGTQAPSFFRYRVGDVQVTAVHDGVAYRALDGFVPNAPAGALQQALAEAFMPTDRFPITFTTLVLSTGVLSTGGRLVLIDTGNGDLGAPTSGTWMANFRAAGFDPAAVDTVVISHFHGDHINGLRLKDGTAVFPRAQVMVPEPEWAYWTSDATMAAAPDGLKPNFQNVRRVFGPMGKEVSTFAWGQEVVPGLTAMEAAGHTPGHTAFDLRSGTDRLLVMSDVTNQPAIFARHPDWSAVFDMDAAQARATRRRLLDMAATERVPVSFYHAPFPATGHIRRDADGYALVPRMWTPEI